MESLEDDGVNPCSKKKNRCTGLSQNPSPQKNLFHHWAINHLRFCQPHSQVRVARLGVWHGSTAAVCQGCIIAHTESWGAWDTECFSSSIIDLLVDCIPQKLFVDVDSYIQLDRVNRCMHEGVSDQTSTKPSPLHILWH